MQASWWTIVAGAALLGDTGCNKSGTTGAGGTTSSTGTSTTAVAGTTTSVTATTGTLTYCNPVTGKPCNLAGGSTCDWGDMVAMTYICLDPPPANTVPVCGACNGLNNMNCAFGSTCIPIDTMGGQQCMKFCCTDADCGGAPNSCDNSGFLTGIGFCGKANAAAGTAVPVCTGIPATSPSNGSCYTTMPGG